MQKESFCRKVLTWIVSICFFMTPLGEYGFASSRPFVPSHWGRWTSTFKGLVGRVVLIADLHGDPVTQNRIALILRLLEKQGFRDVALEGADGPIEVGLFASMPDQRLARRVAQYWLMKGELTGAEFAASFHSSPLNLFGVEDPRLYLESLKVFRKGFGRRDPLLKEIRKIRSIFGNDISWYESLWQDFMGNRIGLDAYLQQLMGFLGPSVYFFFPKSLHFLQKSQARSERSRTACSERSRTNESFDSRALWSEIENLKSLTLERSARSQDELAVNRLRKWMGLLELLIRFEMTRWDWDSYRELKKWMGRSSDLKKILRKSALYEHFYRLSLKRDRALAHGLLKWMKDHPGQDVVMIVGGFHLKGVIRELTKANLNLYCLVPHSPAPEGFRNYEKVLLGQGSGLDQMFLDYARISWSRTLAPVLKLSLGELGESASRNAFKAASIALYELVLAKRLEGEPDEVLRALREHRVLWRGRYEAWLLDFFGGETDSVRVLKKSFDDFEILEIKKDGDLIEAKVRLFGYETVLKISMAQEADTKIEIKFVDLAPFLQPFSFFLEAPRIHAVIRRTLVGHFPRKLRVLPTVPEPIRDYVKVYNRAVELRKELSRGVGLGPRVSAVLASSDRPALEEFY